MPKFKVLLQQYVEQIAAIEVEAESPEQAKDIALDGCSDAVWETGEDACAVECYAIMDETDHMVWER